MSRPPPQPYGFLERAASERSALYTLIANHWALGHIELGAQLWRTLPSLVVPASSSSATTKDAHVRDEAERWLRALLAHPEAQLWTNQCAFIISSI